MPHSFAKVADERGASSYVTSDPARKNCARYEFSLDFSRTRTNNPTQEQGMLRATPGHRPALAPNRRPSTSASPRLGKIVMNTPYGKKTHLGCKEGKFTRPKAH